MNTFKDEDFSDMINGSDNKCVGCNASWVTQYDATKCPFCGSLTIVPLPFEGDEEDED